MLLDYFQTWIGVLASLLVLCIALGANNLHTQILKNTKDRIQHSIDEAEALLDSYVKNLKSIVSSHSTAKHENRATRMGICILIAQTQQHINISLANKPSIEAERTKTLLCIEERIISATAPFYSLTLCILLFLLDGMAALGWVDVNGIFNFLTILLAVSSAFWLILWIKDYKYIVHIIDCHPFILRNTRNKQWTNLWNGMLALVILYFFGAAV